VRECVGARRASATAALPQLCKRGRPSPFRHHHPTARALPPSQGGTLTAYRKFRKNYLDSVSITPLPNWPANVRTRDGCMIHVVDSIMVPGAYQVRDLRALSPTAWSQFPGCESLAK
jgi:hypothetical protein